MRSIEEIEKEIQEIMPEYNRVSMRLSELKAELKSVKAQEFIRVNNITKDDVWMSDGKEMPWFVSVWDFAEWIKKQKEQKRFTAWNTVIYFTSDILGGKLSQDMPATTYDL